MTDLDGSAKADMAECELLRTSAIAKLLFLNSAYHLFKEHNPSTTASLTWELVH